jgi:FAD/FMN-containing dehydrogenase
MVSRKRLPEISAPSLVESERASGLKLERAIDNHFDELLSRLALLISVRFMQTRRKFIQTAGLVLLGSSCATPSKKRSLVNDVHTHLNPTWVDQITETRSLKGLQKIVHDSVVQKKKLTISGGRHAGGGQQFGTNQWLVDTRKMNRVLNFDRERGLIEVESGIQWRELMRFLIQKQTGLPAWTFAQKQTGTDHLTIGGAVASNIHGRALTMKPFIGDIESFVLVDASGAIRRCSRSENAELFRLAIGGYGLFGMIYSVTIRLVPRSKVERVVSIFQVEELIPAVNERIKTGFIYGDFQFAVDSQSEDFLRNGVFSCYRPVAPSAPIAKGRPLTLDDWRELVYEAHVRPTLAFEKYAAYYKSTSGQIYWSDLSQFSRYLDGYHKSIDQRMRVAKATEVITELYVPRAALTDFMAGARKLLRRAGTPVIYGTIRFIEPDEESFLAWAGERYACIIFNLHTEHTTEGIAKSKESLRGLIDLAIAAKGSFYLTYHRYATREQLLACYPQFPEFLARKKVYDPHERFESDWYRHQKQLLA